jgi:pimeloyl-ACP methyl ester carboxylesterase
VLSVPRQRADYSTVIGWADEQPYIDARQIIAWGTPKDGTQWHDRVAARSMLSFSWRRPVRRAASVRIPFLLVVPEADSIAPVPPALEVARRAPGAQLFRSAGGHYDVYEGGAGFADVLRTEVDFLHRHAKTAAKKSS